MREPDHAFFRLPDGEDRTLHVHVCSAGSRWEREHPLFRDFLRAHPQACAAYATLKHDLARRFRTDRLAYTEGKTGFVLDTLDASEAWARAVGWRLPDR